MPKNNIGGKRTITKYMPKTFMYYSQRKRTTINSQYEAMADATIKELGGFNTSDLKKYNANDILGKYKIDEAINKTLKSRAINYTNEEKKKVKDNIYKIYEYARKEIKEK